MRLTLVEVLGEKVGAEMYSMEWLERRVRWHLDENECTGEVFVAESEDGELLGHTIVRVEADDSDTPVGLFSTTYVEPDARRSGVASALLGAGEAWLKSQGMTRAATNTSASNEGLKRLFEGFGYAVTLFVPESNMVRLEKTL